MKKIVLIFIAFSLVTAHVTKNYSKIMTARKTDLVRHPKSVSNLRSDPFQGKRIVGGDEALPHSFPYQAALYIQTTEVWYFCGGSLITTRCVLTAAHCLKDSIVPLEVILGAHDITQTESSQQIFETSSFKIHEKYNSTTAQNDLGLVYLPTPAELNDYVQLIPLASDASISYSGQTAIASGWGVYSDSDPDNNSPVLRYVELSIISNLDCMMVYSNILDSNVCTTGAGDGKGTCRGDSGGPLVVDGVQVGITSFGSKDGCEVGYPAVFARVTSYLDWIKQNTDHV